MGWGDEIIASGQARKLQEEKGATQVAIYDRGGSIRDHDAWLYNPRIYRRDARIPTKHLSIFNGPGIRPYIRDKTWKQWKWRNWECPRGEIYFSDAERAYAESLSLDVVIEPNLKAKASPNKNWGLPRWTALIELLRAQGRTPVQLGSAGTRVLPGCVHLHTPTMRHACAALSRARAAILPEGGLHHAAAALGIPSVVIFGGYISPRQTGYSNQTNLFSGDEPCGMRIPCEHCEKAMSQIEPELVIEKFNLLKESIDVPAPRDLVS